MAEDTAHSFTHFTDTLCMDSRPNIHVLGTGLSSCAVSKHIILTKQTVDTPFQCQEMISA